MALLYTNNASSTLASSILASDLTFSVAAGQGALFPTIVNASDGFYVTLENAAGTTREIVYVTGRTTDTFTVIRAQEGTTALAFASGDTVELRLTAKSMAAVNPGYFTNASNQNIIPGVILHGTTGTFAIAAGRAVYLSIYVETPIVLNRLSCEITGAASAGNTIRLGICSADRDYNPTSLVLDAGTIAADSTGVKDITIAITLMPGRYLLIINPSASTTCRHWAGHFLANGYSALVSGYTVLRYADRGTNSAFPSTLPAVTGSATANGPYWYFIHVGLSSY